MAPRGTRGRRPRPRLADLAAPTRRILTGQAYVQAFAARFPFDQRRFVTGCVTVGFDHGLLAELRNPEPS